MDAPPPPADSSAWHLAALDAMPMNIALLDGRGVIVDVNLAWQRFARENAVLPGGPEPGIGPGADYLALCDAASGPSAAGAREAAAGIRAVLAGQLPSFAMDYPCHAPGQQRWFQMTVLRLEHGEGKALVVHADITGRKIEESRRRDSELRLQLALDATGDGIWDWDLRSGQAYLSPGYYALTGYRAEDELGSLDFFRRLVHPDDWPQVTATMEAHLRGETPASEVEYRMLTADGAIRWIRGRGRVVERDEAGAPLRMLGLISDITALKRVEHELQGSEARYRAVVEDQTEIISRLSADGTIIFANDIYCRFFGKAPNQLVGTKWQPVAHPDDVAMVEAQIAGLSADNPVVVIENRVFAADGSVRWMQFVNRGRFDAAGCLREIQSVGRDVTERRELEDRQGRLLDENMRLSQELIRIQEKERAALAKELHDELSSQLVAIRAYARAISRRNGGGNMRTHQDAQAIDKVAGDIYAISHRLMEGLHPEALDSAGLAAAIDGLMARWTQAEPNVRLCLRATALGPCSEDLRINLFRIAQECLANAFRHGRPRRIRVFVGERRKGALGHLRLVVRDDGMGMRLDAPRMGYGLIIMRERTHHLGGTLELSSEPGRGTRVAVTVPLAA